jgi:hypothetical protein
MSKNSCVTYRRKETNGPNLRLPSINIKSFLGKVCCDDSSPRELTAGKSLDGTLCRLGILVLDVDLADTETGARTGGAGDLGLDDGAVLLALLFDVFFDFYLRC